MLPETQGQRITARRRELRYTQEYVAEMLDTTKQAIYKYEKDIVTNIPDRKLYKLAQLLGCSVAYLKCQSDELGDAPITYFYEDQPQSAPTGELTAAGQELLELLPLLSEEERRTLLRFARFLSVQPRES